MAKPCAVFWDIQNGRVPGRESTKSIANQIRSAIIEPYNLNEIFFFCVCDIKSLPKNIAKSLIDLDVDIVQASDLYSTGDKILDLMRKFVAVAGQDCTIILLNGDDDYYDALSDLKQLHNVSIHLVTLDLYLPELKQISDSIFELDKGVLKPIKSTGAPMYFISIKNYPLTLDINYKMATLNSQIAGSIQKSAILFYDSICIGFPTLWNAEKAVEHLNKSLLPFLKVELIVDSPLTEILKCIKPNIAKKTESNNEVKQLIFIKMNNSNEADNIKIIKFYIPCTSQSECQCILTRKSFNLKEICWLVFSCKSDAQDCLSKIQIMYPDAIISEPPFDLTSSYQENPYTVESCEQKAIEATSRVDNTVKPKPEKDIQANSQNQSSSGDSNANIGASSNIMPKATEEPITLKETMNSEPRRVSDTNVRDDNGWNIFFRCDIYFVHHVLRYQPTKWTMLYTLYEQLCDLGVKKVISDGNLFCAHFDSVSTYQDALAEKRSRYLEPLEFVNAQDLNKQFKKKMDRYMLEIPWCLNSELGIHCLVLRPPKFYQMRQDFKELCKEMLDNICECIFIKSVTDHGIYSTDEYWIGFPDEPSCKHYEEIVLGFLAGRGYNKQTMKISTAKPFSELLESIDLHDLVGDAYDLAFLSNQLESSKAIAKPSIIERIRFLRAEEQKCIDSVPHVTIKAFFCMWHPPYKETFSLEQTVKIIVNFSKVIPIAATATIDEVNLIFNSDYEKYTAYHFITNFFCYFGAPYFPKYDCSTGKSKLTSIFTYYVINDKRKVLEKIVQNKNLMDRQHSNLSTTESTSNFGLTDEVTKKLKYSFIITTDSEFKFTSGMISIIKMNLVQMDCPACIEYQDKIWVGVDDLEKGDKAKANINQIKFKILHEKDDDDFEVGVIMESVPSRPTEVDIMSNRLVGQKSEPYRPWLGSPRDVPLGHFNYNCRKAATRQTIAPPIYYFQSNNPPLNNLHKRGKKKNKNKKR